jgi:rubrerythrin
MSSQHEKLLQQITEERDRILSRRRFLTGTAGIAAGGAVALTLAGGGFGIGSAFAQDATPEASPFEDDIAVLNYALTLEHLEYAFYRDGVDKYELGTDGYGNDIKTFLTAVRDHEKAHVDTLTSVITDAGGTPVEEAKYDFGYTDAASFLATAAALENTGVRAYDGAGQYLANPDLLTAAGSIVAVEARHASYLNLVTGAEPAPASFETVASPAEVLEIAGPFIVG